MKYHVRVADLGCRLPFSERGDPSGTPLLLLHGFADPRRSFDLVDAMIGEGARGPAFVWKQVLVAALLRTAADDRVRRSRRPDLP